MIRIKALGSISVDDLDNSVEDEAVNLYSKALIFRQEILNEMHRNDSNFKDTISIFQKNIKDLIQNSILDFKLPNGLLLNIENEEDKYNLELRVAKELSNMFKKDFDFIKIN